MLRVRLQHSSVEGIKSMCSGVRAEHVDISKAAAYNLFMLLFSSKKCLEQGGDWGIRGTLGLHDKFGTRVMTDFCFPEDELPKMHAGVMEARSCTWCVCAYAYVRAWCVRAYVHTCVPACLFWALYCPWICFQDSPCFHNCFFSLPYLFCYLWLLKNKAQLHLTMSKR